MYERINELLSTDFVPRVPVEVSDIIFNKLNHRDLITASQTCRLWARRVMTLYFQTWFYLRNFIVFFKFFEVYLNIYWKIQKFLFKVESFIRNYFNPTVRMSDQCASQFGLSSVNRENGTNSSVSWPIQTIKPSTARYIEMPLYSTASGSVATIPVVSEFQFVLWKKRPHSIYHTFSLHYHSQSTSNQHQLMPKLSVVD